MTHVELVQALSDALVKDGGHAYALGYMTSFLNQAISQMPKKQRDEIHSDLVYALSQRSA